MRKKRLLWLILLLLLLLIVYKIVIAPVRGGVAAKYREHEVTWTQVEQLRSVLSLRRDKEELDDRALVDRILLSYILMDEAKELGVKVSESEAVEPLKGLSLPDGKTSLEDYLAAVGESLRGSAELLRQQIRSRLTLDKLKEALAKDYCEQHGIDFKSDNLPEEVERAVSEKIDGLLESHKDEIEYYF